MIWMRFFSMTLLATIKTSMPGTLPSGDDLRSAVLYNKNKASAIRYCYMISLTCFWKLKSMLTYSEYVGGSVHPLLWGHPLSHGIII